MELGKNPSEKEQDFHPAAGKAAPSLSLPNSGRKPSLGWQGTEASLFGFGMGISAAESGFVIFPGMLPPWLRCGMHTAVAEKEQGKYLNKDWGMSLDRWLPEQLPRPVLKCAFPSEPPEFSKGWDGSSLAGKGRN